MRTFFKEQEYRFLVETSKIENKSFLLKLLCQKPMLRETEWRFENRPITKSGVLPVTTLFFGKFVSVLELLKRVNLMYQRPKCPHFYFS